MANVICHVEYDVTDLDRAQKFYGAVFDWTFRSFGDDMVVFGVGDQHLGGFMRVASVVKGDSPSLWIQVDSIEETLSIASELGAPIVKEKSEVPNVGWSAQFSDPDGNAVGIVQFS